jgi:DNA-binding NarL/FixJ family response regulator
MTDRLAFEIDVLAHTPAAEASDHLEWQPLDLSTLWHSLCSGAWRLQETFDSDSRCYATVERVAPGSMKPLRPRQARILGTLLLGQCHKQVAFAFDIGVSTIASAARDALGAMGFAGPASRAPLLLAMAACAALSPRRAPVLARCARVAASGGSTLLVSATRPDMHFPVPLSPAEADVARQLMRGETHAGIARRREASCRTVANQLAAVFQKLGVSGRAALTAHVIRSAPEFTEPTPRRVGQRGTLPTANGSSHAPVSTSTAAGCGF